MWTSLECDAQGVAPAGAVALSSSQGQVYEDQDIVPSPAPEALGDAGSANGIEEEERMALLVIAIASSAGALAALVIFFAAIRCRKAAKRTDPEVKSASVLVVP